VEYENIKGVIINAEDIKRVEKAHSVTSFDLLWISERDEFEQRSDPEDIAAFVYSEAKKLGADALFEAGVQHYNGTGVPMRREAAITYFIMAAELGHIKAMVNAAMMFMNGDGVERNYWEAYFWFWNAMMKRDARAVYFLGDFYMNGYGVVNVNHAQAADYYEISAQVGHSVSQFNLGVMMFKGDGVPKDEEAGVMLISKAADAGFKPAMQVLGRE